MKILERHDSPRCFYPFQRGLHLWCFILGPCRQFLIATSPLSQPEAVPRSIDPIPAIESKDEASENSHSIFMSMQDVYYTRVVVWRTLLTCTM